MTIERALAEALEWQFRTRPPAAVETKARELALDTLGCVLAARRHGFSYGQVLDAYITGYEIGGRLGEVLRMAPGMHVDGNWPCYGVAAAVVRLFGGSAAQALTAMRIVACQLPHSLYLPVAAGANARNTYASHAAQFGMLAANAAMGGAIAPEGALAGPAIAQPGKWFILEAYVKSYAAVRHVHYGAAAAQALRPKILPRLHEITRIRLATYAEALTYCGNRAPRSAIQAQFSLSYGVACMLVNGELVPDSYASSFLESPVTRKLEEKMELSEKPGLDRREATLEIELGKETLSKTIRRLSMTREEILAKFARYSGLGEEAGRKFLGADGARAFAEVSPA